MPAKIGDSEIVFRNLYYIAFYDSIKIGAYYYKNIKLYKTKAKNDSYSSIYIYWAKNVGIIKRVTYDGHTWELIKYHLQ